MWPRNVRIPIRHGVPLAVAAGRVSLHSQYEDSVERAGNAVELQPAPRARYAAHPCQRWFADIGTIAASVRSLSAGGGSWNAQEEG
jgi:hypothetical protein